MSWPSSLPVMRVRIARPTDRLDEVVEFYRDGLGLVELGSFDGHSGYDGVMLGLPGSDYHLEFTSHEDGSPCPAPSVDNLLVLYLESEQAAEIVAGRLADLGYPRRRTGEPVLGRPQHHDPRSGRLARRARLGPRRRLRVEPVVPTLAVP